LLAAVPGESVALRYVLTDGRIEMCWPCRVVEDSDTLVALFIAARSRYKAGPKRTAAQKRASPSPPLPPDEYVWRQDTLRLMLPGRQHSVWLFWENGENGENGEHGRRLNKCFVNMEEPYRRTPIGFDTQDHTLDIVVNPDLTWNWRDEAELQNHVTEGFFTPELAESIRAEGVRAIDEIRAGTHPCQLGWHCWMPAAGDLPEIPSGWDTTPPTYWNERHWAYGYR
jgi:hypothetical protein